jgi:hypothetical protein
LALSLVGSSILLVEGASGRIVLSPHCVCIGSNGSVGLSSYKGVVSIRPAEKKFLSPHQFTQLLP